jgi:hypothetical protein
LFLSFLEQFAREGLQKGINIKLKLKFNNKKNDNNWEKIKHVCIEEKRNNIPIIIYNYVKLKATNKFYNLQ